LARLETSVGVLPVCAREAASRPMFTFLVDGVQEEAALTYGALDRRARAIAAHVQSSCAPGARIVLLDPPGLDSIAASFGRLFGGFVAPFPPMTVAHGEAHLAVVGESEVAPTPVSRATPFDQGAPRIAPRRRRRQG
jgi:acyl-CoA synthetase (AMP-forming)/AMP-acid ligase II